MAKTNRVCFVGFARKASKYEANNLPDILVERNPLFFISSLTLNETAK